MDPHVTEVPAQVLRREHRLRILRALATAWYMVLAAMTMLSLLAIFFSSGGLDIWEEGIEFMKDHLYVQILAIVGVVLTAADIGFRYKRAYRYL